MLKLKLIQGGQEPEPEPELMGGNIMITPTLASQLTVDLRPGICRELLSQQYFVNLLVDIMDMSSE